MIYFPKKYTYKKDISAFHENVKHFSNVLVLGERAVIIDLKEKESFFTKGAEYQIRATIAKYVFRGEQLNQKALCFPGFNHSNWYHIVADIGFQIFQAKQRKIAEVIILPVAMKSFGETLLEFLNLFDLHIEFINHPRFVKKVSNIVCFDKFSGRLTEAMKGGELDSEINDYFDFLHQCFLQSDHVDEASKYSRKIFSTRRGNDSRVYERVIDIEMEYEKKGYQIVYFGGMNTFEQMAAMQNATHFSGFHGANLTNLLFAHRCEFVEELITRELSGDFQTIANFKKANHSRRKLI